MITTGLPPRDRQAGLSLGCRSRVRPARRWWLTSVHRAPMPCGCARSGCDSRRWGTVRADNPRLTVRGLHAAAPAALARRAHALRPRAERRASFFRRASGAHAGLPGKSLRAVLRDLAKRGCTSVMIEAGERCWDRRLMARLVDRVAFLPRTAAVRRADVIAVGAGSTRDAGSWRKLTFRSGRDLLLTADVRQRAARTRFGVRGV